MANVTIERAIQPLEDEDLYQDQHHVTIVLRYDSTLKKNISGPLKYVKGAQAIFDFTVRQRQFANDAKTVESLEDLEASVSVLSLKLIINLNYLYRLMKWFKKDIVRMINLYDLIQIVFLGGKSKLFIKLSTLFF